MNFLAHIYLSRHDEEEMVGNFLGDFVKGRNLDHYPPKLSAGIRLHRLIDVFTDTHPIFEESKQLLKPYFKRYTPVVIDMFYDHFLAANWSDYCEESLEQESLHFYDTMEKFDAYLPERVKYILPYMKADNWLLSYATVEGIGQALQGINRRTGGKAGIGEAIVQLTAHYEELKEHFQRFFPLLQEYVQEVRSQNK
ncbi:ACP phosphodiesterase [Algivirga pacifica]|uniref:Acyl carrier protein phosphodiesterase n=1 Tax=Algivirga pacifica TaxID=1162670 RepID=A0ABP9D6G1_9BACT